jgi:hypothetical protein
MSQFMLNKMSMYLLLMLVSVSGQAGTIILKADDFSRGGSWYTFLQTAVKEAVPVNIGVISDDLREAGSPKAKDILNKMQPYLNQFAFFYHGKDHNCDKASSIFLAGDLTLQNNTLRADLNLLNTQYQLDIKAFGAPCNHANEYTATALNSNKVGIWLLPYVDVTGYEGDIFTRRLNLEVSPGKTDIQAFLNNLNNIPDTSDATIIVQFHPGLWKASDLENFLKATSAIESKGWTYRLLK